MLSGPPTTSCYNDGAMIARHRTSLHRPHSPLVVPCILYSCFSALLPCCMSKLRNPTITSATLRGHSRAFHTEHQRPESSTLSLGEAPGSFADKRGYWISKPKPRRRFSTIPPAVGTSFPAAAPDRVACGDRRSPKASAYAARDWHGFAAA